MINLTQRGETEGRVRDTLESSDNFMHFNAIVQSVIDDAAIRTHEVLEDLESEGVVECDSTGNRWRLKDDHRKDSRRT